MGASTAVSAVSAAKRRGDWRFAWLPRALQHRLIRRGACFPLATMEGLVVEVATATEAYLAAFRLVHDAYVGRGWLKPQPSGFWVTSHHVLPESTVFVLRRGTQFLGTVALIEDSPLGLPIDHTFSADTQRLRGPERHLVEVGSLALAPEIRRSGAAAVLMAAMWRYAYHRMEATDLLIAVSADVAVYYEALFDFAVYTPARDYAGFGVTGTAAEHDPVVGLRQDVVAARAFAARGWSRPSRAEFNMRSLVEEPYPAAFERVPEASLCDSELARHKLPRAVFQRLFREHTGLIENLDEQTRAYLLRWRTRETVQGLGGVDASLDDELGR